MDQARWTGLLLYGGTPWDDLRPSDFTSQPYSSNTSTSTNDGLTTTLTTTGSVTGSVSGTGGGSGSSSGSGGGGSGGSWDESYEQKQTYLSVITGTDANGKTVDDTVSFTYDLNWHAWGSGDGTTNYKVTEDVTRSTIEDTSDGSGGSYDLNTQDTFDGHLMAEGVVDSSNSLVSGDFTYDMDGLAQFSLTDGSGTPTGSSPGYSVNYLSSEDMTLDDSGSLIPDSSNQGTNTVTETQNGQVSGFDGAGGSSTLGFNRSVEAIDNYDASQPSAGQDNSPPQTQPTTIDAGPNAPRTQVPTTQAKNIVYVIDTKDEGDPNDKTTATGQQIKAGLRPADEDLVNAQSLDMAVKGLGKVLSTKGGKADVLVIGDHAISSGPNHDATGHQEVGKDLLKPENPESIIPISNFVKKGGTLILTGCNLFDSDTVKLWQKFADDQGITIIGAATNVNFQRQNGVTAVWVPLKPGNPPPIITK